MSLPTSLFYTMCIFSRFFPYPGKKEKKNRRRIETVAAIWPRGPLCPLGMKAGWWEKKKEEEGEGGGRKEKALHSRCRQARGYNTRM